tara:strand:+ start:3348 stop:5735 length:2388 start_codon:yes stop_codon:yes gene_type:complete
MNNRQNNSTAIILILIMMMISSMMSSSAGILGFNLFTAIRPSQEVSNRIKKQEDRVDELAKQAGIDGKQFREELNQEIKKGCFISVNAEGKCPEGTKPKSAECCEFIDPKMPSTGEVLKQMAPDLAIAIIGGILAEIAIIVSIRLGIQLSTAAGRTAVVTGAAAIGRTAATQGTRVALTQMGTRFAAMMACSPPCTAATIAFAVFTVALDMTDPFGYNNFTANEVIRRKRNTLDVNLEEGLVKDGNTAPLLFPLSAAYPELDDEFREKLMTEFLPDAMELMPQEVMVEFLISQLSGTPLEGDEAERVQEELGKAMEKAFSNTEKRDKFAYQFYVSKGKGREIEKVPWMSSKSTIGVTLNEKGAKKYNERMKEKHLLYSNPHRKPPAEIPTDYSPFTAAYTDTYRVLNKENPGEKNNPNVVEKKLKKKVCLCFPYAMLIADCEYGFNSTKHSQRLNPAVYGVTYNYERGECNFTHDYCKRLGLKLKGNECKMREGQKEAELILGKTITRTYIRDWDNRIDAFKSGDPVNIMLGVASLNPYNLLLGPWTQQAVFAIKDTYGRGVGTPMVCGPNKERKGALCYPKCREGYKSSALECEKSCPPGSKNTGLTCLQPIHAFIPSNKSSNPFDKGFYQRKACGRMVDKNSTLGREILKQKEGEIESRLEAEKEKMRSEGVSERTIRQRMRDEGSTRMAIENEYLQYKFRGTTCNEPCLPSFTFRSGAAGSAFCDKPRNRYSRAGKSKVPDACPGNKVRDASLCYKPCKPGYRGNGPTCKKTEESRQGNVYTKEGLGSTLDI